MKPKAVILAAGIGKRLRPLTIDTPKPLLPNINESLLLKQINYIKNYTDDITITIGYKKDKMLEALKLYGLDNYIVGENQENAFWINSHKFKNYDGPLVVITCDNVMEFNLSKLLKEYYENDNLSILLGLQKKIEQADKVKLKGQHIVEINKNIKSGFILSGLQLLNIRQIQGYNLKFLNFYDVWQKLIEEKQLLLSKYQPDKWTAIDTAEELSNFFD